MFCPKCGTEMPDEAQFCPACGADAKAGAAAPAPTAPLPVAVPQYAPPPSAVPAAPPKKKTGLVIAIVVISLLLLCFCGGVAAALFVPAIRDMMPWAAPTSVSPKKPTTSTTTPLAPPEQIDDAAIRSAAGVVSAFYAGINSGDLAAVTALVTDDTKSSIDPGAFEGWTTTNFEYTRGWIEGDTAYIIGREDQQAYGAGENGGVKFTLLRTSGSWLIDGWQAVDTTQVEGSDTAGSSTGIPGPLSDSTARDVVNQILEARKVGASNIVRRLATEKFLTDNADAWLDGIDNSEYFSFSITTVKLSGSTASVIVSESWPDGTTPTIYGLVERGGAVLVDTWQP